MRSAPSRGGLLNADTRHCRHVVDAMCQYLAPFPKQQSSNRVYLCTTARRSVHHILLNINGGVADRSTCLDISRNVLISLSTLSRPLVANLSTFLEFRSAHFCQPPPPPPPSQRGVCFLWWASSNNNSHTSNPQEIATTKIQKQSNSKIDIEKQAKHLCTPPCKYTRKGLACPWHGKSRKSRKCRSLVLLGNADHWCCCFCCL